jgi:hypothetical protein
LNPMLPRLPDQLHYYVKTSFLSLFFFFLYVFTLITSL